MDDWLTRHKRPAALILLLVIGVGVAMYIWRMPRPGAPVMLRSPSPTVAKEIKVYVTGAVARPGVYALMQGDRVEQALLAAGGVTDEADLERINLSVRVKDEDHIHVPRRAPTPGGANIASEGPTSSTNTKVNLNTASASELDKLPGIGPVTAARIIEHREKNGPLRSVEDLLELKLVNRSTYEKIKDLVTVR